MRGLTALNASRFRSCPIAVGYAINSTNYGIIVFKALATALERREFPIAFLVCFQVLSLLSVLLVSLSSSSHTNSSAANPLRSSAACAMTEGSRLPTAARILGW
ncbi:hypothetical protein F5148DRAFT_1235350 [Russula earlei]|uniref:Uncharacterized protein n=1 Tax=Russula earlei TaxID=71964 RepID=A0ACC0TXQ6_9AGAM|nr:hypothetical protein F5148DRAFT_1235350 [Russula earlei]